MSEGKVISNYTTVLFPFRFDRAVYESESFNREIVNAKGKALRPWEPEALHPYHTKQNVGAMLGVGREKGSIGTCYKLNDGLRRALDLPDARTELSLFCRAHTDALKLRLNAIELTAFYTGIGFLEFSFVCESADPAELLDINYFLCEVKSRDNYLRYERRISKDESEEHTFTMLELVSRLLEPFGPVDDFDTEPGLRYIDCKPLIFAYHLYDSFPEELGRLIFNLRTNFKASYRMPESDYDIHSLDNVYHPFENVYWGNSLNGAVCLASLTGDDKTDSFFKTTFPSNLRETYLPIFLLREHQRFAVQELQRQFSLIDSRIASGEDTEVLEAYDHLRELESRAAVFKLRCRFRDPTSVEHINNFDHFIMRNLHTAENFAYFEDNVRQIETLASELKERIDRREQQQREADSRRRERAIYVVTALWSAVVFLESAWELVDHLVGDQVWFDSAWVALPFALGVLPMIELFSSRKK